ncbi:MAG: hypothetical protein CL609_12375 [Anaerolineaceae bacterium]|nr:hypothetical protein [Anaerolineaceae bacterium]
MIDEKFPQTKKKNNNLFYDLLFVAVILIGLYLRVGGLFWGDYQYLHPDERFLVWVTADMHSVQSLGDYFNTAVSTLNPHNVGHGFYVYGDFPVILTRYLLEAFSDNIGWRESLQFGRSLSAFFDLAAVVLIYFIGKRLFNKPIGLLAALFSAMAVLQIQQAHFYTVDTFSTFFTTLAVYIAVRIATLKIPETKKIINSENNPSIPESEQVKTTDTDPYQKKNPWFDSPKTLWLSLLFGVVVGLAAASKINTVTVAILLPAALIIVLFRYAPEERGFKFDLLLRDLIIGGVFALISFRIFQPYAFSGPGFFGISLNPAWIEDLKEIQNLSSGDVDFPPAVQWARRDFLFAFRNMTVWGLGLPLGITAWLGFFLMAWRIVKGEWKKFILPFIWTAAYFVWMSSLGNPMMRYQLPVYPLFALMAAWFIGALWEKQKDKIQWSYVFRFLAVGLGIISVFGTALWAYMFSRIYINPMTRVEASHWIYENIPGAINLMINRDGNLDQKVVPFPNEYLIEEEKPYTTNFIVDEPGNLDEIRFAKIQQIDERLLTGSELSVIVYDSENGMREIARGVVYSSFQKKDNDVTPAFTIDIEPEVLLKADHVYQIVLEYKGQGALTIKGSALAAQTQWDEGVPVRFDGLDGFGGIYQGDLNFEVFWDENQEKLSRFLSILDETDYIMFSSNRQYGTITRIPEKYPLTTGFYRELLGCPVDSEVLDCYNVAQPGDYNGNLGFDLIKVFESYPQIGNFKINDLSAEEAFSVYDHPKVLIFKKSENYNPQKVREILGDIDLDHIVRETPGKFPDYPADLMLPPDRLTQQRVGGTWSELFNTESFYNRHPGWAVVIWYLVITIFGWFIYPIIRAAMPGLDDKAYPFSKFAGMLLLAFVVWQLGSAGVIVTRMLILVVLLVLMFIGAVFAWFQRESLRKEFNQNKKYFLLIEGISLLLFVFFLLIRLGNPDLWHPSKGGEKPMDFAYFNAVLKSSTYPPYDPWFAGGYINYYYYGFVIVGVFVKLLGIVPSIAYNLILPTLFSFVGIGSFSVVWNLINMIRPDGILVDSEVSFSYRRLMRMPAMWAGTFSIFLVLIFGNLGTVRMIWHGLQKLGSPDGNIEFANFLQRITWTFGGIADFFRGESLPFYPGDWYWVPSRALPKSPITEFPFFTFTYADLHAHMIALPITIFALVWIISIFARKWQIKWDTKGLFNTGITLVIGAIIIGALRPTNTWDFPTYLVLAILVVLYTLVRYGKGIKLNDGLPLWWRKILEIGLVVLVFLVLVFVLYQPFANWYGQGYSKIDPWKGDRSPFWSYFTHWGLFLFIIISCFFTESVRWMSVTPLSALKKLKPYRYWIYLFVAGVILVTFYLLIDKVVIAWLVLPLAAWALILMLNPRQSDAKRFVLFIIGTALVLTLVVEVIVLRGDIERMNTVFKFYMQAWVMLGIGSAAGFVWMLPDFRRLWSENTRNIWQSVLIVLVGSAAMYPLFAASEKIDDRMTKFAPVTLDGMTYMSYSNYYDANVNLDLSQDFRAIRWMQENVVGSPVIVEANTVEYRWGSRFTIYTGLPSVVGWNWHQRQQRAVTPSEWVTERVDDVANFYLTSNQNTASDFIETYDVQYIIVGQYERALYPGEGLEKFERFDNILWQEVYRDQDMVIYEVKK